MKVGLTESDLDKLFTTVPLPRIVSLEDTDSEGLYCVDAPIPSSKSSGLGSGGDALENCYQQSTEGRTGDKFD